MPDPTAPIVNVPLLRKAVEWAEVEAAKPEELCEWYQRAYYVLPPDMAQAHPEAESSEYFNTLTEGRSSACGACFCIAGKVAFDTAGSLNYFKAHEIARDAMGLTPAQSTLLFAQGNTIEDVRRIAESIAGERL